ncbi:TetR/AcrR family transcriptional regulator [Streptomyces liangshanensis]|uniref:TetR/AcrR family transcriptional regulator n=1 Tax=Streptomyces liangshanensis TaxID=2717324 RepID=A0A6G9H4T4_9ACTN|nr:TetR/AcrR family transcriptional regulator [Streptomyces liangshanensis]
MECVPYKRTNANRAPGADTDGGSAGGGLRRAPVQRRSAERLTRILDTCAALLDEAGYEQLTTRAVASRAGVPIGSVYRFFDNKRALVDALARRNLDRYAERVTDRFAALRPGDWRGAVDVVLDEYLAMKRTVPGFGSVDFGSADLGPGSGPGGAGKNANQQVAGRLTVLLAAHLGRGPDASLHRTVLVAVEAADALLQLAFRTDPAGDPGIVAETRTLLRAYLARTLDRASPAREPLD